MRSRHLRPVVGLAVVAGLVAGSPPAFAQAPDDVDTAALQRGVTVNGVLAHARALQTIATLNDGTRASGTPGYEASLNYVARRLERAGYDVAPQRFTFPFFDELADPQLTQVSPTPATYATDTYDFSGSGDVTGRVVPASDNLIPPPAEPGSTAGCEPEDFRAASATEAEIALVQRGTCEFRVKVANAQAAGYDAVVIFNEGQPGRDTLFVGTLGRSFTIPVVGVDFATGAALDAAARAGAVVLRVVTSTKTDENATTWNLLADTPGGDDEQVVVVGAHLDSVTEGPGINDNGSGTATILEIAEEMAESGVEPLRKVRFAFWGAEEANLLGSEHYVEQLGVDGVGSIYANLNFDMVGSPNYVRFVYDGDGSSTEPAGPPGSGEIEALFNAHFAAKELPTSPTAFDGRSDYGPFIDAGIPAGGVFSGAEGVKTAEQAQVYGGVAGRPYDPCYHQACDTIRNINTRALSELGDGAAHAALTLALSEEGLYGDGAAAGQATAVRAKRITRAAIRKARAARMRNSAEPLARR